MAKEYKFTTIKELFDRVPSDKIELCLDELKIALLQASVTRATFQAMNVPFEYPGEMTWVDDDKGEIISNFVNKDTGEDLGSFTVSTK